MPTCRTAPSFMTTSRSAMVRASSWSCVTMTVVRPSLRLQLADLDADLLAKLCIEVRERLVEQQHVGPEHEGTRQRHALLLAAGQLPRQALAQLLEADEAQRLGYAVAASAMAATLRISRPKATFCATVRCGNSA